MKIFRDFSADTRGATAIEYALIGSLLSVAIILALLSLNGAMTDMYEYIRSHVQGAIDGANGS